MKYTQTGTCIWCLKKEPEVTFNNKPHTISKKLGSKNIGFDICDACNHYFGSSEGSEKYPISVELAFKEIISIMKLLLKNDLNEKTFQKFKSRYFSYYHSRSSIKINKFFSFDIRFIEMFTRQFKRSVYEVFLQEYHRETKNGLDKRFDNVRDFVRNDLGNLPLYFLAPKNGYLIDTNFDNPKLVFNDDVISKINDYGFFMMFICSNIFFLEVTPKADFSRDLFLSKVSKKYIGSGFLFSDLRRLEFITDIDFTLRRLFGKKKN